MEITLDIGKNTYNDLGTLCEEQALPFEDFTINMLELGLRVFKASKEPKDTTNDPLKLMMENNEMLKETIRCVFEKSKPKIQVYDAESLITCIENSVDSYLKGKEVG